MRTDKGTNSIRKLRSTWEKAHSKAHEKLILQVIFANLGEGRKKRWKMQKEWQFYLHSFNCVDWFDWAMSTNRVVALLLPLLRFVCIFLPEFSGTCESRSSTNSSAVRASRGCHWDRRKSDWRSVNVNFFANCQMLLGWQLSLVAKVWEFLPD